MLHTPKVEGAILIARWDNEDVPRTTASKESCYSPYQSHKHIPRFERYLQDHICLLLQVSLAI